MVESGSEQSISRTCILWLPVFCEMLFQPKEQDPHFPCGCSLFSYGLGDADSSFWSCAEASAPHLQVTCPALTGPQEMCAGKAALAERAEAAV